MSSILELSLSRSSENSFVVVEVVSKVFRETFGTMKRSNERLVQIDKRLKLDCGPDTNASRCLCRFVAGV